MRRAVDETPKWEQVAILEATVCRNHGSINGGGGTYAPIYLCARIDQADRRESD